MLHRLTLVFSMTALLGACGSNQTWPPEREDYQPASLQPLDCVPDLDGAICADELSAAVGVRVSYLVSPDGEQRPVDLVGAIGDDGQRIWDWGADYASDQVARLAASELAGKWYAASFPEAAFVAPFDAGDSMEQILRHNPDGLYLLGLASTEPDPPEGRTLLVYQQPVLLYRFPLQPGESWVSVGEIRDGLLRDLPYAGRDVYEVEVDGGGELVLPDLTFTQVLRVRTRTVVEPAAGITGQLPVRVLRGGGPGHLAARRARGGLHHGPGDPAAGDLTPAPGSHFPVRSGNTLLVLDGWIDRRSASCTSGRVP